MESILFFLCFKDFFILHKTNYSVLDFEKKSIRAAAAAQERLKCPISFHPGRNATAPFEIMRIFTEAGGDPKKAIMSHLDRKKFFFVIY